MAHFMVRYGEIALKSPRVRRRFETMLSSNIASMFIGSGKECRLEHERGRIFLWSDDQDFAVRVLSRAFGVVSFSKVEETSSETSDIFGLAVKISKLHFKPRMRFCVRARRSGQHGYTSMELARDAGSAIFLANEHLEPKVDLTNPELEIFIDVRQSRAFVYTGTVPGPGGMPLGSQGRVLGVVRERRDIAACWLMMKRGCRVIAAAEKASLAEPLKNWDPGIRVVDLQNDTDLALLARRHRADGICLGWGVADVDKQGSGMTEIDMPVFHPLVGMTAGEIENLLARIEE